MLPRGGGTSQCGQTVNESLVIDCSKHLTQIFELDVGERRCTVEPGIVLDDLNRAAQAARPVVPGRCLDRLARHHRRHGGEQFLRRPLAALRHHARQCALDRRRAGRRHARRISARCAPASPTCRPARRCARSRATCSTSARARPTRSRRVSQGAAPRRRLQSRRASRRTRRSTISRTSCSARKARSPSRRAIELKLSPVLGKRAVGACHFGSFYEAMNAAQHLVKLEPDRGRAGRPHHDRARARDRDVPPDAEGIRARRAGGDPAGRVRRGRGRERAPAQGARTP